MRGKIKRLQFLFVFAGTVTLALGFFVDASWSEAMIVSIPVSFTSQSPMGKWVQPWEDFCEEASIVMVSHFVWDYAITPQLANVEMRMIQQYEDAKFKRNKDTSIGEVKDVLENLYGFQNLTIASPQSPEDIKNEIRGGKVVIVPFNGRMVTNPYFTPPGPAYHMIVVRGYDDTRGVFITNEPGTSRGSGYMYGQYELFNAIHDWNNGDVMHGEKLILSVGRDAWRDK